MRADDVAFLLEDEGSSLTLARQVAGTYDPATGQMSATTPTTHTVLGVFIEYRADNVDGTVIRAGDRLLLVSAIGSNVTPAVGDRVDGLEILAVRSFAPNGTAIAWACQARG